jgi:hypothetical protein
MKRVAVGAAMLGVILTQGCGGSDSSRPPSTTGPSVPPITQGPAVFVGAGDIGMCGSPGPAATASLLDRIDGSVFTTGDNAYPDGTAENFRDCYDPHWGRHKLRTRPSPGNHDYHTLGAAPYFEYFGALAGPSGLGYYSFELGAWHIVSLNSNVPTISGSPQLEWLREDLSEHPSKCTLAYWHHPLFTGGPNQGATFMREMWQLLYESGAEVVLNGHNHLYERFAPQDPNGRSDLVRGIRQFTVGTGGGPLYPLVRSPVNLERGVPSVFGVLKLTLLTDGYAWEFIPVAGSSGTDSGVGTCH